MLPHKKGSTKKNSSGRVPKFFVLLMGLFGVVMLLVSIGITITNISLALFGRETTGHVTRQEQKWENVVVGYERSGGKLTEKKAKRPCYYAIVVFETQKEDSFEIESMECGLEQPLYPTGSTVTMIYLPNHPEDAQIVSEMSWVFGPGIAALFGIVCIGAALFIMVATGEWTLPTRMSLLGRKGNLESTARTRSAVGAIITHHEKYVLIHRVTPIDTHTASVSMSGYWDFPTGELQSPKEPPRTGLLRILYEQTGSQDYTILQEFEENIIVEFPQNDVLPDARQETTIFLVEYTGDGTELASHDEEIDQVRFFLPEEVLERISSEETKAFFKKHVSA